MSNFTFSRNPIINITRSKFKRNHRLLTTFNAGKIVPIQIDEVLPGDTKKLKTNCVIRMSTPIKPVMDNAFCDIMHFFIPARLLWEHWKEFQGENSSGYWKQQTEYTIPQTTAPTGGWNNGTLADYFGIPTKVSGLSVNSLPFRAYVQVWNDWFRDENNQNPAYMTTGDGTTTGTNGTNLVTDVITGGTLLPCAKIHDYFTSALPEPQKGPDVLMPFNTSDAIPVTGRAPVITQTTSVYDDDTNYTKPPTTLKWVSTSNGNSASPGLLYSASGSTTTGALVVGSGVSTNATNVSVAPGNLWASAGIVDGTPELSAQLSATMAPTINQLRLAFQLQKMYEKDARGGTRYIEIIKNHFGVTSSDARLQRSEYLGGSRVPITMQQVNQTSSTDETSPQGNTAAFSLTADSQYSFTKSFEEHGYILSVAMVRTTHTYQQGLNKLWNRKTRTDFYMPVFANIGEQPIYNKEIYAQGTDADDEVFGYQEAWADYRYFPNQVTGQFRSNNAENGGLDIWHYADYYTSKPTLGTDFIQETANNIDRTLAVQSSVAHQFLADFYFESTETRPLPIYSIPGLIDHH